MKRLRDPFTWIALGFVLAVAIGATWDVPCTDSWSHDEVSPRATMLGAVFLTWTPGHFFRYPPLHVLGLTILQSPLILAGALRAGTQPAALEAELIHPGYMTIAALIGRAVSMLMALGIVANVRRLFARIGGEEVGLFAAAVTALNAIFVYFAHVASVDVPYLFWTSLVLVELDRVAAGEGRPRRLFAFMACALLTKDQSAMLIAVPAFAVLVVRPWRSGGARAVFARATVRPALVALAVYLVGSGMVSNPSGFRAKLAWMKWGNEAWVSYERSPAGVAAQLRDVVDALPIFAAPGIWLLAGAGLVLALRGPRDPVLVRRMLPLFAAVGYLLLFVIPSRWVMERHLMPLALFLVPYAGFVFADVARRLRQPRWAWVLAGVLLVPQLRAVASVDATLLAEPKNAVEARLAELPAGTKVVVLGGNPYLPRLPAKLDVVRIGAEPLAERSALPGVREIVAPYSSVRTADADWVVVGESFADTYLPHPGAQTAQQKKLAADVDATEFFSDLVAERAGFRYEVRAECKLPWPLECRRVHLSTGAESWLFRRAQ
jgi:hypothetical protein